MLTRQHYMTLLNFYRKAAMCGVPVTIGESQILNTCADAFQAVVDGKLEIAFKDNTVAQVVESVRAQRKRKVL